MSEQRPSMAVPAGEWEACADMISNALARLELTRARWPGRDIAIAVTELEAVQDRFQRVPRGAM